MSKSRGDVGRLSDLSQRLLAETERLRRDVSRLYEAVNPLGLSPMVAKDGWAWEAAAPPKVRSVDDAIDLLARACESVFSCERDLSTVRGRLDNIASDPDLRSLMKSLRRD